MASDAIPCTEKQSQKAVRELFELYRWDVVKLEEDRFAGAQGMPDLLCTSPHGLQLWIEMKRPASKLNPKGHVRKAQKARLIEWRRRGVPCCVADGHSVILEIVARHDWDHAPMEALGRLMADYDWWPA
jgi:hypothetical protein